MKKRNTDNREFCEWEERLVTDVPDSLNKIVDVVLNYRPKSKQPKPRKRKKAKKVKHV